VSTNKDGGETDEQQALTEDPVTQQESGAPITEVVAEVTLTPPEWVAAPAPAVRLTPIAPVPVVTARPSAARAVVSEMPTQDLVKLEVGQAEAAAIAENFEKARAHMSRAIDADPKNAKLHALMGHYTWKCKQLQESERTHLTKHHLGYAIELNPREPLGHFYLGLFHWGLGDRGRARASWQSALAVDPSFKSAIDALERRTTAVQVAVPDLPGKPRRRRPGLRGSLVAGVVVALLALGGSLLARMAPNSEYVKFAAMLGIKMKIRAAHAGRTELHIDVGSDWGKMSESERQSEASIIAENGARLGFTKVIVHTRGATGRISPKEPKNAVVEIVGDTAF